MIRSPALRKFVDLSSSVMPLAEDALLYHYTTQNALECIIKGGRLRLTHISEFEDTSEWQLAFDMLSAKLDTAVFSNKDENIVEGLREHISNRKQEWAKGTDTGEVFVSSFTPIKNSVKHWEEYGAAGNGVCFGLSFKESCSPFVDGSLGALGVCLYEDAQKDEVINALFEEFLHILQTRNQEERIHLARHFIVNVDIIAPFFKEKKYSEEQEFRFACVPTEHNTGQLLREDDHCYLLFNHYVNAILPIKELMIGRNVNKLGVSNTIESLMKEHNYNDVRITYCE